MLSEDERRQHKTHASHQRERHTGARASPERLPVLPPPRRLEAKASQGRLCQSAGSRSWSQGETPRRRHRRWSRKYNRSWPQTPMYGECVKYVYTARWQSHSWAVSSEVYDYNLNIVENPHRLQRPRHQSCRARNRLRSYSIYFQSPSTLALHPLCWCTCRLLAFAMAY